MTQIPVRILLIEDDPNLGLITQEALEIHGFKVTLCKDGKEGLACFIKDRFELCLIDVMLPVKDGFTLAEDIRKMDQKIPLIFLTAKCLKEDRIKGFQAGGDDYITKPFSMEELVLRIRAVLRRMNDLGTSDGNQIYKVGCFLFDYPHYLLKNDEEERKLTFKEAELLRLLLLHQNQILDRELALDHIWGEASYFTSRSMDVYISKLRKYLKDDPRIDIANIHGRGFKFTIR